MSDTATAGWAIGLAFIVVGILLFDDLLPRVAVIAGGVLLIVGLSLRPHADT